MQVCAGCGLRDPSKAYGEVDVLALSSEHWLHVGDAALGRLRAVADLELLKVAGVSLDTGATPYEWVAVRRELLHNMTEIGGNMYHLIPEAVRGARPAPPRGSGGTCCRRFRSCCAAARDGPPPTRTAWRRCPG
mmetsp:Transcript_3127/g.10378  ORF Transcript_3127/g.10378 Transcript_3127/m.10378 type:complete len:134 (+) Transcript_3127:3-404(+)